MLIRVDPASDVPLFVQVATSVRADAAAGRVHAGDRLPAARVVAESLGINVHTVLRAYQELRDEGLIDLRRGKGAVVTELAASLSALSDDIRNLVTRSRALGISPELLVALLQENSQ